MGYCNHFEIGWVLREYTRLIELARRLSIKSPEVYYDDGKKKGGLCKQEVSKVQGSETIVRDGTGEVTEIKSEVAELEVDVISLAGKPRFQDFPKMVEKNKAAELPKLLNGFTLFRKK